MTNHISTTVTTRGQASLASTTRSSVRASVTVYAGTTTVIAVGDILIPSVQVVPFIAIALVQSCAGYVRSGAALATYLARTPVFGSASPNVQSFPALFLPSFSFLSFLPSSLTNVAE